LSKESGALQRSTLHLKRLNYAIEPFFNQYVTFEVA
jgi:hypothetical protein